MVTRRPSARSVVVALALTVALFAFSGVAGAANPWIRVAAPSPGNASTDVNCLSPVRCTAIGTGLSGGPPVLRTLDGANWVPQPVPHVGAITYLHGIDCVSLTNCTIVGGWSNVGGEIRTLVLRKVNGGPWTRVASPNPDPHHTNAQLSHVSCPSASTCVAVASVVPTRIPLTVSLRPFILATDDGGAHWMRGTTPPGITVGGVSDIDCRAAHQCTAVGSFNGALVLRSDDGVTWTEPDPATHAIGSNLDAVSCPSTRCRAVGNRTVSIPFGSRDLSLVLRES